MPINQRYTTAPDEARRVDPLRRNTLSRHPLLALGTRHAMLWQQILDAGNPVGGITNARLRDIPCWHPQVMADLKDARLIKVVGKIGTSNLYIADPSGVGILPQFADVVLELFEAEDGAFIVKAKLKGQIKHPGKIVRRLLERTVRLRIPVSAEKGFKRMDEPEPLLLTGPGDNDITSQSD